MTHDLLLRKLIADALAEYPGVDHLPSFWEAVVCFQALKAREGIASARDFLAACHEYWQARVVLPDTPDLPVMTPGQESAFYALRDLMHSLDVVDMLKLDPVVQRLDVLDMLVTDMLRQLRQIGGACCAVLSGAGLDLSVWVTVNDC